MFTEEIKNLTIPERIELVEEIWESIIAMSDELPLTPAQRDELDRRIQAYHQEPQEGVSWDQVKARMKRP